MHTTGKGGLEVTLNHRGTNRDLSGSNTRAVSSLNIGRWMNENSGDIRKSNTSGKVMMNFHNGSRIASSLGNAFQNTGSINSQMKILCGCFSF